MLQCCGAGAARSHIILAEPEPTVKQCDSGSNGSKRLFNMDSFQKMAQTE
jgi:hypothetical protein